jgi:NAD(P)H dehydrogenase (quinone)
MGFDHDLLIKSSFSLFLAPKEAVSLK